MICVHSMKAMLLYIAVIFAAVVTRAPAINPRFRRMLEHHSGRVKVFEAYALKICGIKHVYNMTINKPPYVQYCCKCRSPTVRLNPCKFGKPDTTVCACVSSRQTTPEPPVKTVTQSSIETQTIPKGNETLSKIELESTEAPNQFSYTDPLQHEEETPPSPESNQVSSRTLPDVKCTCNATEFSIKRVEYVYILLVSYGGCLLAIATWKLQGLFESPVTPPRNEEHDTPSENKSFIESTDGLDKSANKSDVRQRNASTGKRSN